MEYRFYADGSLDIGGLRSAYPQIDGVPLRALSVAVTKDSAAFTAMDGSLTLRVKAAGAGLTLSCEVDGFFHAHDIAPIGSARMEGVTQGFKQGLGIAGPSGLFDVTENGAYTSDGVVALKADTWLTLHVNEHRDYRNRYEVRGGSVSALFDVEGTLTGKTVLPDLYVDAWEDLNGGLRACADGIASAMGARHMAKPAFHWCSWYYLYHNLDEKLLAEYAPAMRKETDFSHLQIDAGYFPSPGDWLIANERFPKGMEAAGAFIRENGYGPGVWIAPFMVGDNSELFKKHPDWMLHNPDGSLFIASRQYNEPKVWGYVDCHLYVLDTSHPDAMAYICNVFATYVKWGYTLFKTDFLLWGLQDSTKVLRHTPGKTGVQYFRELMENIRRIIGDIRWLGCIAPFLPCVGCVDMMRIAGDVGAQWNENSFGPQNMVDETLADQYFNGKYWLNDPDAVMLRDFHIYLEKEQVEALALFQAMSGSVVYTSDPVHKLADDRKALLRMIRPEEVIQPEFVHWMEGRQETVLINRTEKGVDVLVFNTTRQDITVPFDVEEVSGIRNACVWKWHEGQVKLPGYITVKAKSAHLYFVSAQEIEKEPQNLWKW